MKFSKQPFTVLALFAIASCHNGEETPGETKDNLPPVVTNDTTPPPAKENVCFLKALKKDSTFVNLTIEGNNVSGNMRWHPWQKDGAIGTLTGTKGANGEMQLLYDYMIEGSKQTETKIMKIENDQLKIKTGELIDPTNNGHLIFKDSSKLKYTEVLQKVVCP